MSKLFHFIKKIPIDFGQANLRIITKGKLIAMDLVPPGNGKKALDIGCRAGNQSERLKSDNYSVESIDIETDYPDAKIVDANKALPYSDDSFDLIWSSEVIEHLKDPEAFKKEITRIIKSTGDIILTTPNSAFWIYYILRLFRKRPKDIQNPTHIHFFSISDIKKLFPLAKIYGFFPYLFFKFRITRLIGFLSPTFVIHINNQTLNLIKQN
ncbi:MAG: Ubiquinone biosynthesis O-methyltransferase [Candidatus Heimdallarchaeota archaeon LC_2]|nr:MAG: Ubiquinone biosynthesis O-methyltransferase [Candidatus Heimdallarchaeota archaeon LC_2]